MFYWIFFSIVLQFRIGRMDYYKMLPFKQKMFRQKPYTNCFECIQGQKLKCKKCMSTIIESILQRKRTMQTLHNNQSGHKTSKSKFSKTSNSFLRKSLNHSEEGKLNLLISTNYQCWMDKVKYKRQMMIDPAQSLMDRWPHKKPVKANKLKRLQEARFQNWQKRFLKRLQNNTDNAIIKKSKSSAKVIR